MLKRLPITIAQVKACNTSGNILNEIRQTYTLCVKGNKFLYSNI